MIFYDIGPLMREWDSLSGEEGGGGVTLFLIGVLKLVLPVIRVSHTCLSPNADLPRRYFIFENVFMLIGTLRS